MGAIEVLIIVYQLRIVIRSLVFITLRFIFGNFTKNYDSLVKMVISWYEMILIIKKYRNGSHGG